MYVEPDEECQQLAGRLVFNIVMLRQLILLPKDVQKKVLVNNHSNVSAADSLLSDSAALPVQQRAL